MKVNEVLQDKAISHAHDLDRYSNGVVYRIIKLLNKTDSDLVQKIAAALERLSPASFTVARLQALLKAARATNAQAFVAVNKELTQELKDFAKYEAGYQYNVLTGVIPKQVVLAVDIVSVSPEQVYAAAMARPMQGRLLKDWASGLETGRMRQIQDAISIGYTESQTTDEIVRRIRGTRAKGYSDGVLNITRRHAESVVRTAVSHVAATARSKFQEKNDDIIKAVRWVSTLDSHTTKLCMIRDGLLYEPVTHKPVDHHVPWLSGPGKLHFGCRSIDAIVTKSLRELGLDVDDFKPSTRAAMDGQVPADMTYGQWLKKQSAARQDEILGPTRAALFRQGKVSFDKFYSDKGVWLSLDDLRKRDAETFKKYGM